MPVTLLTPVALLGLAFLLPLLVLHLRQRRPTHEVASILLWRELVGVAPEATSGPRLASLPLLLLQALALTLLVLSLARPTTQVGHTASAQPAGYHVFILDDSVRMMATDLHPNRLAMARQLIMRRITDDPAGTVIVVVVAAAQSYLLVSSADPLRVRRALAHLAPPSADVDLAAALLLGNGLLPHGAGDRAAITLLHARGDTQPKIGHAAVSFSSIALGRSTDNQAITQFSMRCATYAAHACVAFAVIRNESNRQVADPLVLLGNGDPLARRVLILPGRSSTGLALRVPEGTHILELRLARRDILPLDNAAWCVVPAPRRIRVALVGQPARVAPIRKAFLSLADVEVDTSVRYAPTQARESDAVILDAQLPPADLPLDSAAILIDPPSLPGGRVLGPLADTVVSGADTMNPLLADVDVTSLDVPAGAAERLKLPDWMVPVIWSPSGPLLAAGGTSQRVAVLAFDPLRSNVTQMSAFPLLLRNLLQWAEGAVPASVGVGSDVFLTPPSGTTTLEIAGPAPGADVTVVHVVAAPREAPSFTAARLGVYTIIERGPWGTRLARIAANAFAPAQQAGPQQLQLGLPGAGSSSAGSPLPPSPVSWWPWIGIAALVVMASEWFFLVVQGGG